MFLPNFIIHLENQVSFWVKILLKKYTFMPVKNVIIMNEKVFFDEKKG